MNIVKKVSYSVASAALVAPVAVFAQITTPSGTGLPEASVTDIVTNIMKWLLMLVGILGVIGFVIAGILYLGCHHLVERDRAYIPDIHGHPVQHGDR